MATTILRYAAFTDDPAGGNPAGVVLDSSDLDEGSMQQIAAEIGYSETAFLTPVDGDGVANVRYFSPVAEVPFCGHATIASAVAVATRSAHRSLRFLTPVGEIPVDVTEGESGLQARLLSIDTSSAPIEPAVLDRLLGLIGWSVDDLDPSWPVHVAYAGNYHPILATRTRDRLRRLDYDFLGLKALMTEHDWTTVNLIWPESADVIHARNPFPVGGVVEDPATGAAAAALGGYLIATQPSEGGRHLLVRQGEDLGRPSRLHVKITPGSRRVGVLGGAVEIQS